ncbi:HlyD family efflux transporter periplasmic adaptor subunit [Paraflavisolibacter sp. H34]|uniref:efflux RND transporter periplasmic adaptor subunit n=1 Tax=Huijunlia imazamoxiresistens TaxID=3127457 RepID=UPI003016DDD3
MDIVLPKKKWGKKKWALAGGLAVLVLGTAWGFLLSPAHSRAYVPRNRVTISTVSRGPFGEYIPVNGIVLPLASIYLDALEGGRVEERYAEDGALLQKGAPILKLANTDLELSLVNQETAVFNLLTQMQISRNAARQNSISRLNQMAEAEHAWKEAERVYRQNERLVVNGAVSRQEFMQSQLTYDYCLKKKRLTSRVVREDSLAVQEEERQARQSYQRMQNALAVFRRKVEDLVVRAPVSGQLTSLDAEIGQNKNKGERLGQIDATNGFKVRADIDEHYISKIFTGLEATYTFNGNSYPLIIKKVFSQVTNGLFQVDMAFAGKVPPAIRRGQTLQVRLALGDEQPAVRLPRGGFYQQSGGLWVFRLSEKEGKAYRVPVQLGRQNPDFYEVIGGLQPGDRVVTSGYETFSQVQELVLEPNQ